MEFYKTLGYNQPNKKVLIFGIVLTSFSFIAIIGLYLLKIHNNLTIFLDILTFILLLNGFKLILQGNGFSIGSIIGKNFIRINDLKIEYKATIFKKTQSILWKDIKSCKFKTNHFEILSLDDRSFKLPICNLSFQEVQTVKDLIFSKINY